VFAFVGDYPDQKGTVKAKISPQSKVLFVGDLFHWFTGKSRFPRVFKPIFLLEEVSWMGSFYGSVPQHRFSWSLPR